MSLFNILDKIITSNNEMADKIVLLERSLEIMEKRFAVLSLMNMGIDVSVDLKSEIVDNMANMCHIAAPEDGTEWRENTYYSDKTMISYNGDTYICKYGHVSDESSIPHDLWDEYDGDEFVKWYQPDGIHDSYRLGDKVTFNNNKYICKEDYNIKNPEESGWEQVTEIEESLDESEVVESKE